MDHHDIKPEEMSWFEKPGSIKLMWIILIGLCVLSAVAGVVASFMHLMHPYTIADKFPVFYGVYGFAAFMFIVLAGQHLRKILMRDEDYYDTAQERMTREEIEDAATQEEGNQ